MSEIRALSSTAMKTVLDAVTPGFEKVSGCRVDLQFAPSGRMAQRVAGGEAADVAIVTSPGIDDLIANGRIVPGSRVDIACSSIGLAVRKGAPIPDISTVEGFKQALLSARSIAMSHPTGGAQSGAHLAKVFERLGIAEALSARLIYGPGGPAGLVGNYLLRQEADIGLQQMPELMAVPGIAIIGPIPDEVQLTTVFSAGVSTTATNPEGAVAWIRCLKTREAAGIITASGMQPA